MLRDILRDLEMEWDTGLSDIEQRQMLRTLEETFPDYTREKEGNHPKGLQKEIQTKVILF